MLSKTQTEDIFCFLYITSKKINYPYLKMWVVLINCGFPHSDEEQRLATLEAYW
jgi:hypothetical protein